MDVKGLDLTTKLNLLKKTRYIRLYVFEIIRCRIFGLFRLK